MLPVVIAPAELTLWWAISSYAVGWAHGLMRLNGENVTFMHRDFDFLSPWPIMSLICYVGLIGTNMRLYGFWLWTIQADPNMRTNWIVLSYLAEFWNLVFVLYSITSYQNNDVDRSGNHYWNTQWVSFLHKPSCVTHGGYVGSGWGRMLGVGGGAQ